MTTTFRARFEDGKLVPQEPVDLPSGEDLQIEVRGHVDDKSSGQKSNGLKRLAEIAAKYPPDPNSPGDAAAQHDHYLYGTPKRDNP